MFREAVGIEPIRMTSGVSLATDRFAEHRDTFPDVRVCKCRTASPPRALAMLLLCNRLPGITWSTARRLSQRYRLLVTFYVVGRHALPVGGCFIFQLIVPSPAHQQCFWHWW